MKIIFTHLNEHNPLVLIEKFIFTHDRKVYAIYLQIAMGTRKFYSLNIW